MPYNHTKLELRLSECDKRLDNLFEEQRTNVELSRKIKAVKNYYNSSYVKASEKTVGAIVTSYESFVAQLSNVKNGIVKPDIALKEIESAIESRRMKIIFYNLAKACELIFWAATAFSLYAGIYGIALPVLFVQPLLGVAACITIIGAMLAAACKALSCFEEFKSLNRHDTEYANEISLISFFKTAPKEQQGNLPQIQDEELDQDFCCVS